MNHLVKKLGWELDNVWLEALLSDMCIEWNPVWKSFTLGNPKKFIAVVGKLSVAGLWRIIDDQENIFLKFFIEVFGAVSDYMVGKIYQ